MNPDLLASLVEEIYRSVEEPGHWRTFLDRAAVACGADRVTFLAVNRRHPPDTLFLTPGFDADLTQAYIDWDCAHSDYWAVPAYEPDRIGHPWLGSQLASKRTMRRAALYNEVAVPADIEYMLGGILLDEPEGNAHITLLRGHGAGDYDADAVALAEALYPHIKRALRLHWRVATAGAVTQQLSRGLAALGIGLVIADAEGRVLAANQEAERILGAADGLVVRRGLLCAASLRDHRRLRKLLAASAPPLEDLRTPAGGCLGIRRPSGALPYEVVVYPTLEYPASEFAGAGSCTLLVRDRSLRADLDTSRLERLYGLTEAEARLVAELFMGGTLAEAAVRLGVSPNTAKSQLRAIYEKLGVSSKAGLMRVVGLGLGTRYCPRDTARRVN